MHETQLRLVMRFKGAEPQVFALHETHGTSIALALKPCNDLGHVHGEEDTMGRSWTRDHHGGKWKIEEWQSERRSPVNIGILHQRDI